MSAKGLTYDTGALVAAERDDRLVWSLHRAALARGLSPTVPVGVLAEGWRGGPQPTLSRFLKGYHVEDLSEASARAVGALAARAQHDDIGFERRHATNLLIAPAREAARRPSNPTHIRKVVFVAGADLAIYAV